MPRLPQWDLRGGFGAQLHGQRLHAIDTPRTYREELPPRAIDWKAGTLCVEQRKTRYDLLLPVNPRTLSLLRGYLRHGRPRTSCSGLFLRARTPAGPISHYAVGDVFKKRARESGLAALHTFARFLTTEHPAHPAELQRILCVPFKRGARSAPIEYLEQHEVRALLSAIDWSTDTGWRDHAQLR